MINHIVLLSKKLEVHLKESGYADSTIERRKSNLRSISSFMDEHNISEYSPEVGAQYLEYKKNLLVQKSYESEVANIRQLDEIVLNKDICRYHFNRSRLQPPEEYIKIYNMYIEFLNSKGIKKSTIETKSKELTPFLIALSNIGCHSVCCITPEVIVQVSGLRQTFNYFSEIRSFLLFLVENNYLSKDYSCFLPKKRIPQLIPSVYTKEERSLIENTFDQSTSIGKRNRAIYLLASRNGLRASDIAELRTNNIDWENNKISIIQKKTGFPLVTPLYDEVKKAIQDYINNNRPDTDDNYIFITNIVPYIRLSSDTVYAIINRAIKKSSIEIKGRHHGSHAMRSSLATSMINNGITYNQVRKVLGHSDLNPIKHYASLDIEHLRKCALEVHEPIGYFSEFLNGRKVIIHE